MRKEEFERIKKQIKRLERAEKELKALRLPEDVFAAEIESLRGKLKRPSKVNEVEQELALLKAKVAARKEGPVPAPPLPVPKQAEATPEVPAVRHLPELPGYKILGRIGAGGFADIFKAERENGMVVAIKIPKGSAFDTIDPTDFLREAELWSKLVHSYIVKVYKFGAKPYPWIAMEYMEGGSLRARIGRLSVEDSLEIGIKLTKVLFHTHHLGVIHRDIKPENVLFDTEGNPKLTDWGLGKVLLEASATLSGFRGTLSYSAPEQLASAQFGQVDWRTDIYQLGALLYEMLTGQWHFRGDDPGEAVFRILNEEVTPPSKVRPGLPEELDRIVLRAIAKRKEDRPQDVAILEEELKEALRKVRNADK